MTHQQQIAFENIVGKGEITQNEQFLLFPQCLFTQSDNCIPIYPSIDTTSLFAAKLEEPKIGVSGKGLICSAFNETRNKMIERKRDEINYIEDNHLVVFDMKNISRGCVVRR